MNNKTKLFLVTLVVVVAFSIALREMRVKSAIAGLRAEDRETRADAAKALARKGGSRESVMRALVDVLVDEEYTSSEVAQALVDIGPDSVPHVLLALKNEQNRLNHWGASISFVSHPTPKIFGVLRQFRDDAEVNAALTELVNDDWAYARRAAAFALGDSGRVPTPEHIDTNYERIFPRTYPPIVGFEFHAGQFAYWRNQLKHEDPRIRAWAAHHLDEMGPRIWPAKSELETAAKDENELVAKLAGRALANVQWIDDLEHEDSDKRLDALMQIRDLPMDREFAMSKLQLLINDEEPFVRGLAQRMLKKLESESDSESMERRLRELHERIGWLMKGHSKREN